MLTVVTIGRSDANDIDVGMMHQHVLQIFIQGNFACEIELFPNFHIGNSDELSARVAVNHVRMSLSDVSGTNDGKMDDIRCF